MLCVISHVWFPGFIWIYKNVAACNMRAEGKLSKETTGDQGEEKRWENGAGESKRRCGQHRHALTWNTVPSVLNIYTETVLKEKKSCLPSAHSSSPYALGDLFGKPLYLCVCLSLYLSLHVCFSPSIRLPCKRLQAPSKHRGVVRDFL